MIRRWFGCWMAVFEKICTIAVVFLAIAYAVHPTDRFAYDAGEIVKIVAGAALLCAAVSMLIVWLASREV